MVTLNCATPSGEKVLWVDLEHARLRVDLATEKDFDALAAAEMQRLRAQLDMVPTLAD